MAKNLRELIEEGYISLAELPKKNDFLLSGKNIDLNKLETLDGYTVPLISHDYSAKTPEMWNALYEKFGLNIRNIMAVANPNDAEIVMSALRKDPKYLGGGFGVGWKEKLNILDEIKPADLRAVNIVVKENGRLVGYNTDALGFVRGLEDKFAEIGKSGLMKKNIIILGAGGVAKEVAREIARKKAGRIIILNRTYSKANNIAEEINQNYGQVASSGGEEIIRGYLLNSFLKPDAVINLTDKGSDGPLSEYSAFATADIKSENGVGNNLTQSRTIARELSKLNPEIVVADIILPKSKKSITLRIAENEGLANLLDGVPMVVNQAAPAYIYIQEANPKIHIKKVDEKQALETFMEVTHLNK